jgi:hypothetical protein
LALKWCRSSKTVFLVYYWNTHRDGTPQSYELWSARIGFPEGVTNCISFFFSVLICVIVYMCLLVLCSLLGYIGSVYADLTVYEFIC